MKYADDLAAALRASDIWIPDICKELCALAGLADEYAAADGDTVEDIIFRAADILGVEIL